MSGPRTIIHFLSILILLLWSAVLLYFHMSGRVTAYLPPNGIFRSAKPPIQKSMSSTPVVVRPLGSFA